ncbi:MAG: hydrogenase maturation protease [Pseudomonadota bacterium]
MRSAGIEKMTDGPCCLVGYGNPDRRDDGLGPFVVAGVEKRIRDKTGFRFLRRPQLDVDLVEEFKEAGRVILVDAAVETSPEGLKWETVAPDLSDAPFLTHSFSPAMLLGLVELLYDRRPETWLISIQGDDFRPGRGFSREAGRRARWVIKDLTNFVTKEG